MNDQDDDLPGAREKPDWRRGDKGVWVVRLPNGDRATVTYSEEWENWIAEVYLNGKTKKSRPIKDFQKCLAWAERALFPRPTAWDRIRSV
jgi:hypothetical protein